jgi:beta-lactamase class A
MPPRNFEASKKSSSTRLGLAALGILILVFAASFIFNGDNQKLELPQFASHFSFNFLSETAKPGNNSKAIEEIISKRLTGEDGEFAIYIEDLTDHESYALKANESFPSASLYKIYLLAAVLKAIENQTLRFEDTLSASRSHLEEVVGGREFGYEDAPETIEYTVDEAIKRVGRISDNFAAIMLAERVSWEEVQLVTNSIGSKQTVIKSPISTSARDVGNFLNLLYQKKLVSKDASEKIIEALSLNIPRADMTTEQKAQSPFYNRIPRNISNSVKIAHKTGELARIRHDVGIVFLENNPYLIVLMSRNLKGEESGADVLAAISGDVYEYFSKKAKTKSPLPQNPSN